MKPRFWKNPLAYKFPIQEPAEKVCPVCKGTGWGEVYYCPDPKEEYKTCETCQGLGHVPNDGN